MIGILVTVALAGFIIYLTHIYLSRSQNYWKDKGVPYLPGSIFGSMTDVILNRASLGEVTLRAYWALEGHRFGGYFQFQTPVLMVRDPELINNVLIKDFGNFHDRNTPNDEEFDLMSGSIVNMTGERWRALRYKLIPTFTTGKLKRMFSQVVSCSDDVIKHLYTLTQTGQAVEIRDVTFKFSINVIGTVAFGLKIDAHKSVEGRNKVFIDMSRRFFQPSTFQFLKFFLRSMYPRFAEALGLRTNDSEVNEFFKTLVMDTIKHRQAEEDTRSNYGKRNDFLQLMMDLRSGQKRSREEVASNTRSKEDIASNTSSKKEVAFNTRSKEEVASDTKSKEEVASSTRSKEEVASNTKGIEEHLDADDQFLIDQLRNVPNSGKTKVDIELTDHMLSAMTFVFISAGSDTTASILHFVLYELSANPHTQIKLIEEIDSTISSNQDFTYQAIRDMKYLDNVVNETLRIHSPASILTRICTENYQIPGADFLLEKGTIVNVPVIGVHMDPRYFPQPNQFIPERFDEEIPKNVFFPFGGGPRICIAMRLALLEIKVFLARFLMTYSVKLSDKTQLPLKIMPNTIVPQVKGGVWLHLEHRSQKNS